jgi:hypothetical protein
MRNGLGCAVDSGGWFLIDEFLAAVSRYVYPELRQDTPPLTISQLAQLASDGTEDLTKTRWQFSILVRTGRGQRCETWWERIRKVFGIRAVVGHTAIGFLEDDRLLMPLSYVEGHVFSCITHNTRISYLSSIITNGLAPGGDGTTTAVRSQLSAFHMMDRSLQESSRASTSDAIILYNVQRTKPLLSVAMRGVLATRRRILGAFIERIRIKRATPCILHYGKRVMCNR